MTYCSITQIYLVTCLLSFFPGVNRGDLCALIVTILSVLGILTVLPFIEITLKVPNPERTTFSPLERTLPTSSKNTSTASMAALLVRCAFRATCSINSLLVISVQKDSLMDKNCQVFGKNYK